MRNQLTLRRIQMEAHITTHLGYLSNIGSDRIDWATKGHVIEIAKI